MFLVLRFPSARAVSLACFLALCAALAAAQDSPVYGRTRALDESRSQGERQAEQTVSLSAEKLITLFQKETGLLLEVKKLLVRKAFEQGRILESRDLTDEALFRLLREDENIRVLATQEVSKRLYIRALPTRDERQRESAMRGRSITTKQEESSAPANPDKTRNTSQEERYWSDQDRRIPVSPQPTQPPYNPQYNPQYSPQAPEGSPGTQPQPEFDSRRAVEQAQMQDSDDFDGMPTASGSMGSMERISPEDLPELIRARSEQQVAPGLGSSMSQPTTPDSSRLPSYPSVTQPGGESQGGRTAGAQDQNSLSQRASLDTRRDRMSLPPLPRDDHAPLRHRVNPYADVPSLYDLYSQYGRRSPTLVRFGDDVFRNGTGNFDQLPMDLPAGPDYVLGPGDGVNINLWGGVSQRLRRVVDREGKISLPEAGSVQVSGRSLGDVQRLVQTPSNRPRCRIPTTLMACRRLQAQWDQWSELVPKICQN